MPEAGHRPTSVARSSITACLRCRRRKKRCDQRLPACGQCHTAGVECIGYDPATQRSVPRSYIYELENEVVLLRAKLQRLGIQDVESNSRADISPRSLTLDTIDDSHAQNDSLSKTAPECMLAAASKHAGSQVMIEPVLRMARAASSQSFDDPTFSKALLAGIIDLGRSKSKSPMQRKTNLDDDDGNPSYLRDTLGLISTALPERKTAEAFIKAYFAFANFSLPLLHEPTFRRNLDLLYEEDSRQSENTVQPRDKEALNTARFFVNIVFALGLLTLQKQNSARFPTLMSDHYYQLAVRTLEDGALPSDVEGVQALLLMAQFAYMHPVNFGGWNMIGLALRRAVELGLHEDPPAGSVDYLTLDTMRRTFWVAYSLDRNVAIATSRPTCLSDTAITAQYPSFVNDEYITTDSIDTPPADAHSNDKMYCRHWFEYRKLQSEMLVILRDQGPTGFLPIDYVQWQTSMHQRLQQWYGNLHAEHHPGTDARGAKVAPSRFELTFQRALVFLYRPSPQIPQPSTSAMRELASASARVITLYTQFYHEKNIYLFWQAVENIFDAGTALAYSYLEMEAVRSLFTLHEFEGFIHAASNVLWGLVEHFPAFKEKRDAFDVLAAKTLANFSREHRGNIAGETAGIGTNIRQPGGDEVVRLPNETLATNSRETGSSLSSMPWAASAAIEWDISAQQIVNWDELGDVTQASALPWCWE